MVVGQDQVNRGSTHSEKGSEEKVPARLMIEDRLNSSFAFIAKWLSIFSFPRLVRNPRRLISTTFDN